MTALNLFCQGQNAFMLTDAAVTDANGVLLSTRPKILMLRRARMAICWTGFAPMPVRGAKAASSAAGARMTAALRSQGVEAQQADQATIMKAMPGALRSMHVENMTLMPDATQEMASIAIGVALWNEASGPMVVMGQTESMGNLPAYSFMRMHYYLSADQDEDASSLLLRALGRSANVSDPADFDVRRDGLALLEAQRRICKSYSGLNYYGIGGKAVVVRVSKHGVSDSMLRRWPDKVGHTISPAYDSPLSAD